MKFILGPLPDCPSIDSNRDNNVGKFERTLAAYSKETENCLVSISVCFM